MVGATGSGKSTLIDGIVNYVTEVVWGDDFRFTLIDLTKDEAGKDAEQVLFGKAFMLIWLANITMLNIMILCLYWWHFNGCVDIVEINVMYEVTWLSS